MIVAVTPGEWWHECGDESHRGAVLQTSAHDACADDGDHCMLEYVDFDHQSSLAETPESCLICDLQITQNVDYTPVYFTLRFPNISVQPNFISFPSEVVYRTPDSIRDRGPPVA